MRIRLGETSQRYEKGDWKGGCGSIKKVWKADRGVGGLIKQQKGRIKCQESFTLFKLGKGGEGEMRKVWREKEKEEGVKVY